jgi:hypothetical protein
MLALLGTVAGCGNGPPGNGKVSGRVLLDNAPLPGGKVTFRSVDGRANLVTVELNETGAFSVNLPAGEVMVTVDNRDLEPKAPAGPLRFAGPVQAIRNKAPQALPAPPKVGPGRYVKIPERYYSLESSELSFTVSPGEQTHDIPLESK